MLSSKEIGEIREAANQAAMHVCYSWQGYVLDQLDRQRSAYISKIDSTDSKFAAQDARIRIRAIDNIITLLKLREPTAPAEPAPKRRGRPPKNPRPEGAQVIEIHGPTPRTADDLILHRASYLSPQGWREAHGSVISRLADDALASFIGKQGTADNQDLSDFDLAVRQELRTLYKAIEQAEAAARRVLQMNLTRRVA